MPRRLLIIIFFVKSQSHSAGTGFWQDALNVIRQSTTFEHAAQEAPPTAERCGIIPVFRTLYIPQAVPLPPIQEIGGRKSQKEGGGGQEMFVCLFEATLPEIGEIGKVLESLLDGFGMIGAPDEITNIGCRAYQPYDINDFTPEGLVPTSGGTLLINCMTPSPESEASFNRWYKEEHLPMLSAVPGWRSSRRFILVDFKITPHDELMKPPKYLALYEWADDGIFETREYKAAVNTSWRTEVISMVQKKQRWLLDYVGRLEDAVDWH